MSYSASVLVSYPINKTAWRQHAKVMLIGEQLQRAPFGGVPADYLPTHLRQHTKRTTVHCQHTAWVLRYCVHVSCWSPYRVPIKPMPSKRHKKVHQKPLCHYNHCLQCLDLRRYWGGTPGGGGGGPLGSGRQLPPQLTVGRRPLGGGGGSGRGAGGAAGEGGSPGGGGVSGTSEQLGMRPMCDPTVCTAPSHNRGRANVPPLGAYGAHWLLGFIPLTTNCWPEAPWEGGGG